MKKLNRKGFTLVELLAVIIVLAIVVGISIPAVTSTIATSKNKTCGVAVEAAQKWLETQVALYNTDSSTASDKFTTFYSSTSITSITAADKIKALGFKTTNVDKVNITKNSDDTVCVEIAEIPQSSEYYSTTYWSNRTSTSSSGTRNYAEPKTGESAPKNKSSHCA